jgi:putative DNA primase/helicase
MTTWQPITAKAPTNGHPATPAWTAKNSSDAAGTAAAAEIEPPYAKDAAECTDRGNARIFQHFHGTDIRYCHAWARWLAYDGKRWRIDNDGTPTRLAMTTVPDVLWQYAKHMQSDKIRAHSARSASSGAVSAMLKLAQCLPGIPVQPDELDRDPWLFNCDNGTVDLRTGELREHRREDFITKLCPTNFNPDAQSYSFDRFLEAIFVAQDLIDFCRRYFGYCITGDVREQLLLILWGIGSNGKSTFLNALFHALGSDYTLKAVADLLLVKRNDTHPTERADLFGKRLVCCVETGNGRAINEPFVKELTGGDRIRARRLYEDFWEFDPMHKPALCTNHKPRVRGSDHAIWRRLVLLPFSQKFWNPDKGETGPEELRQNKRLPEELKAEAEGILAWLMRGCLEWQRDGLKIPTQVQLATSAYQDEQDVIRDFIEQRCVVADDYKIKAADLYAAFKEHVEAGGEDAMSKRKFGEAMTAKGFERTKSGGAWYLRIGLLAG